MFPCCIATLAAFHYVAGTTSFRKNRDEPAQRGDHRPRRSRQDDACRPALPPVGHVPRQPAGRGAGDGFERPREGARDHHPRQVHERRMARNSHQHRRHARSRRLRRRGRADPLHGRRRHPAGRCRRRADAADQVCHRQGARARPSPDRRRQQDRPSGRAPRRSARRSVRAVPQPRGQRRAARLPDALRQRPRGLRRPHR